MYARTVQREYAHLDLIVLLNLLPDIISDWCDQVRETIVVDIWSVASCQDVSLQVGGGFLRTDAALT